MTYITGLRNANNGFAGLDGTAKMNVAQVPNAIPATAIGDGSVTTTAFQYLAGATSNLQDQINAVSGVRTPVNKATSYTLVQGDTANVIRVTATAQTMSLPTAPTPGSLFIIKLVNVATCTVNVVGGTVTIDGATSVALSNYDSIQAYFNDTNYDIL